MALNDLIDNLKEETSTANGHDFRHLERVHRNAVRLNAFYGADPEDLKLFSYLHDAFDEKLTTRTVADDLEPLLQRFGIELGEDALAQLRRDLENFGFKGGFQKPELSLVAQLVSDADRLDAMGAIGICRTVEYGAKKNRALYDPGRPYRAPETVAEYRDMTRPTIFHFRDKLLKLKDQMFTPEAREMAQSRHDFMEAFLEQLADEVGAPLF